MIIHEENRRQANLKRHGIDFVGAERIFDDFMLVHEDDRADYGEVRFSALGILKNRVIRLIYTERGDEIRIISIRKATRHEQKIYFDARGY